jgi:adenylate cyclase
MSFPEQRTFSVARPKPADALALARRGAAVVTATSDLSLRPRIARAWGAELLAPEGPLRLCVESGTPSHAPAQLAAGMPIAVSFRLPSVAEVVQLKGVISEVGSPSEEQLSCVDEHWLAYTGEAEMVGVPPRLIARLIDREALVSVTVSLQQSEQQPPRPARSATGTGGEPELALESILDSLQGTLPSVIASCAADGTPDVRPIAIVRHVDRDRVALPGELPRALGAALNVNPFAQVLVVSPSKLEQYVLDLEYLHTEHEGPILDSVAGTLEATAAHARGPASSSRVSAVDIHRVYRCSPLRSGATAPMTSRRPADVLGPLDAFMRRITDAPDHASAATAVIEGIAELYEIDHAVLFTGQHQRLFPLAGAWSAATPPVVQIATGRQQVVTVPNIIGDPHDGYAAPRSVAAAPLIHRGTPVGALYLESATAGRFGPSDERLLRIIATQIAVTLSAMAPNQMTTPPEGDQAPLPVTYYQADDSVFFGDEYVIKGVPGRILWKLLREHAQDGREYFTNRELRLDEMLELPPGNDNLDSRLVSLRRRLARGGWGVELVRIGRGRLQLRLAQQVALSEVPTRGPMRRTTTWPESAVLREAA